MGEFISYWGGLLFGLIIIILLFTIFMIGVLGTLIEWLTKREKERAEAEWRKRWGGQ